MKKRARHENALVLADALMGEGFEVKHDDYDVTCALHVRVPDRQKTMGLIVVREDGRIEIWIGNKRLEDYPDEPSMREVLTRLGLSEFIAPAPKVWPRV